jgi:hypothetical protein
MSNSCSGSFWAITCYFNPVGYRRRIENYRLFRRHLKVPLVTVELSFDGNFELQQEDADVLVQIHGRDVMWQKERLLNIALEWLPDSCDKIAWLDCDVIFGSNDWVERASRALDKFALLHLFQERCDLSRDVSFDQLNGQDTQTVAPSVVHKLAKGASRKDVLLLFPGERRLATTGLAWASRREVLEEHGFYDACILGGGDKAILCAALGEFDYCTRPFLMNARREEHYLGWARPYFASVGGRVGYIEGPLFHLWHGDVKDRRYEGRHRDLKAFDFDPFTDVALDANGCWRWNSDNKDLHLFVRRYFESRNEDGASADKGAWPPLA